MDTMTSGGSDALKKLMRSVAFLRSSLDENIPLTVVHSFLTVAQHPGEGVMNLSNRVGVSKSTMSRHLLDLSDRLRTGAPGYEVLKRTHDPVDLRGVRYTITAKGTLILNQLIEIMNG